MFNQAQDPVFKSALASTIPANVKFGTSSWTFEGWRGLVYHDHYRSKAEFTREALSEYGRCPLFRAVGVDSTYYRPPTGAVLSKLVAQAPNLQFGIKAWQEITAPRFKDNFCN